MRLLKQGGSHQEPQNFCLIFVLNTLLNREQLIKPSLRTRASKNLELKKDMFTFLCVLPKICFCIQLMFQVLLLFV